MSQVSRGALHPRSEDATDIQVGVVGLTRVSTSLAFALRDFSSRPNAAVIFTVVGHDDATATMKTAQEIGAINSYSKNMAGALERADIVVVDVPLGQQALIFEEMGRYLKPGAVVLDLSALKSPGVQLAQTHFPKDGSGQLESYIVGLTPLVRQAEVYGEDRVNLAQPDLFGKGDALIVPAASMPAAAVKVASDIADFLGLSPRFMDPSEHDGLAGFTESMPVLQSALFFATVQQSPGEVDLWRAANTRFASTLQNLRGLEPEDLAVLWQANRENILHHIEQMAAALEGIREVMLDSDPTALETFAQQVLDGFIEWEIRRRDHRWEEDLDDDTAQASTLGGIMSNIFSFGRGKRDSD